MVRYGNEVNWPQRVGSYLKNEREKRGMMQEAFAEKAYVSMKTVQRWEKEVDSLTTVCQIAALLQVRVEDIFLQKEDVLPSEMQYRLIAETIRTHRVLVFFCYWFILKLSSDTENKPKRNNHFNRLKEPEGEAG